MNSDSGLGNSKSNEIQRGSEAQDYWRPETYAVNHEAAQKSLSKYFEKGYN